MRCITVIVCVCMHEISSRPKMVPNHHDPHEMYSCIVHTDTEAKDQRDFK